jgi:hypothetical protein
VRYVIASRTRHVRWHADGMSTQWMLAARIDDVGHRPALTVEAVRSLSAQEVSSLDEAEHVLESLTSGSPYQAAANTYSAAIEAFEGLRADMTESQAARDERAWRALQLVVAAIAAAPTEMSRVASEIMGGEAEVSALTYAVEHVQAGAEWQTLRDAAVVRPSQFVWGDTPAGPEVLLVDNARAVVPIQALLNAAMQGLAVITAHLLVTAADKIMVASRVVRGFEAEVLFGRAVLTALPAEETGEGSRQNGIKFRELRVDLMVTAQGALRRSRTLLAAADNAEQAQAAQGDVGDSVPNHEESAAESPITGEGAALSADASTVAEPPIAEESQPSFEATVAAVEAENTSKVPRPPVDLYRVAQHLAETLTAVEKSYGQVPRIDEVFDAINHDSGSYGSFLRQVGIALIQAQEALEAAGFQPVRVNLPPADDDIAALALDDLTPQVRLRQQLTAELLVVEGATGQLQSLQNPTELRLGPGGIVSSVRFDPVAPSRVRGWMLQLARMAEHSAEVAASVADAGAHFDVSAEKHWLGRAAAVCFDHGLHEAALLYLAAFAATPASGSAEAGESPDPVPRELIEETVRRFAAGDTRNASAVAILLVRALWPTATAAMNAAASNSAAPASSGPAATSDEADNPASAQ